MPKQGPTTPEGKAAVRHNAMRHGLRSVAIVVGDETDEQWQEFHGAMVEDLVPEGPIEYGLATRVAESLWCLRRVPGIEAAAIDRANMLTAQEPETAPGQTPYTLPNDRDLNSIVRYEAHHNRRLTQSLHELEVLQKRRCDRTPSVRVDVHGRRET